jgi:hypothetical protein
MTADGKVFDGGCACGQVRYRMNRTPMIVHCCHCTACQRETGTGFAINALVEASEVELLSGAPQPVMTPSESGRGQQIWRCPTCRVAVWSNYGGAKDLIRFVRCGTLDEASRITPDIHIFTRSKLPWVRLPDGARAVEVYYKRAEVWPEDSQARIAALGL